MKTQEIVKNVERLQELKEDQIVEIMKEIRELAKTMGGLDITTQLRRLFSGVDALEVKARAKEERERTQWRKETQRLKMIIAYQVARADRRSQNALKSVYSAFEPLLDRVRDVKDFKTLSEIFEALVGWHRFYREMGNREIKKLSGNQ